MEQMAVSITNTFFKLTAVSAVLASSLFIAPEAHAGFPFPSLQKEVPSLAPMVEQVTPAVVNISVKGSKEVSGRMDPLEYFFGNRRGGPRVQERPFQSLGSGVIINAEKGYVVTNFHVINDADEITVTLKDGRKFEAKKLGSDEQSDIAVLKIDPDDLTEIALADSNTSRVGDFVVAIGNPFGLGQTVTSGIISAKGRTGLMKQSDHLEDFIQTDAAINSGNSGGALVNFNGELVGINTAIIAPSGGNVGIGFAIPSNMMSNLVDQIIEFGAVKRGVLGISGSSLTAEIAESFGLSVAQGAFVNQVMPDSSAEKGGLEAGDVITHIDGVKIKSFNELQSRVGSTGAGKELKLTIVRNGDEKTVTVVLGAADKPSLTAANLHPGLKGAQLTNGETKRGDAGVLISEIEERSMAARQGFEEGDVIVALNRKRVTSLSELRDLLDQADGMIGLNVIRGNSSLIIFLR
jgi:Do/DeqQ family serine protease